jgi:hypothetical protein
MSRYGTKEDDMTVEYQSAGELSLREIEAQDVEALPDRAAMSLVNANLAIPVNLALAANVLSDGAIAGANAQQTTPIVQGI